MKMLTKIAAAAACLACAPALAQGYPAKPIRLILTCSGVSGIAKQANIQPE